MLELGFRSLVRQAPVLLLALTVGGLAYAGPSGSVAGKATDGSTAAPLQGVAVSAVQGATTVKQTVTDASGAYTLSSLTPGTYDILAAKTGYVSKTMTGVSVVQNKTTTVNLVLAAVPPTTGRISGTVSDSIALSPIAGAAVVAVQGATVVRSATTDASGRYLLPDLPAGVYDVAAAAAGYVNATASAAAVTVGATTTVNLLLAEGDRGIRIASVSSSGVPGNGINSWDSSISADGWYVAFASDASNLVSGDTKGVRDIFVHDFTTGATERVSVATGGGEARGASSSPSISGDGRYVAFVSSATNLVSNDGNRLDDIFVRDRLAGTTQLVSKSTAGAIGNAASAAPAISADGRYVAFESAASNLVAGDTNGTTDVFVHDRSTGTTELVTKSTSGEIGNSGGSSPAISADGRFIAFISYSNNLVAGDTNGRTDVFVRDRVTGQTELVSVGIARDSRSPSISADGRYVAFESVPWTYYTVYLRDRSSETTEIVSVSDTGQGANNHSYRPSVSADGRFVAFESEANNLVLGDHVGAYAQQDVFVRDRWALTTRMASRDQASEMGHGDSMGPGISANGRFVAFFSAPPGTSGAGDIFVHDVWAGPLPPSADNDGDGVVNRADLCPGTPVGASVDGDGCTWAQRDDDSDGVANVVDLCPNTATAQPVDANGCSYAQQDDDGDGVPNSLDLCPNTGAGQPADANGCAASQRDSDLDGVRDDADLCPGTPAGQSADVNGCSASQRDTDGDGVTDDRDHCASTPAGQSVDGNGCAASQRDSDGDGVKDDVDLCPGTPAGQSADANGCAASQRDTDNDGVKDNGDLCPGTPAGQPVDADGCAASQRDTDGDGVKDNVDLCPGTPAGQAADANGCAVSQRDTDNDGVKDNGDLCPGTPAGQPVDTNGCAASQRDSDSDGVTDDRDLCPGTLTGQPVDSDGCSYAQRDDDGDGVANGVDLCPNTGAGQPVDASGCAASQRDADGDGVKDDADLCPGTPAGQSVDANGCGASQRDTDGDGVKDDADLCPETPAGQAVDANGCAASQLDPDSDGVTDDRDLCPGTPAGQPADTNGCAASQRDSDGDGVTDDRDLCPGTPAGQFVDANGCAASQRDADGDGVKDDADLCPGTPTGQSVDANGCGTSQQDTDGDGVLDYIEQKLGTNPLNPADTPVIKTLYDYDSRGEVTNSRTAAGNAE